MTEKSLQHVVAGLVPLLYGKICTQHHLLTATLYNSMPARHRRSTTWRRLVDEHGRTHFQFDKHPSWLCCSGHMGLSFLRAACCTEDWLGHSFASLLAHQCCPFCSCAGFLGMHPWKHILQECTAVRVLAEQWGRLYILQACQHLGLSLAFYSVSNLMASFIKRLLEHL